MWTVDLATAEAALLAKDARIADQVHMRGDPVELRPTTAAKSRLIFFVRQNVTTELPAGRHSAPALTIA
jgi:hypothetical protein